jgi:DNA-binding transcriptional ArsR family regulator
VDFHVVDMFSEEAKTLASEIGNETARKILKELCKKPQSITELSKELGIPVSTVKYHVDRLVDLGVVRVVRRRLGKRLKDVRIYIYDKRAIVFLSPTDRSELRSECSTSG